MDKFSYISKDKINELPKEAGVYNFKSKEGLLYIGKAINIRNRVKNHFQQPSYRDNLFMEKVEKIGFLKTFSEIEALILEANLIKKYQPKFNVVWRDDKNYFYVAISENKQKIPYIYITHQKKQPKTEYIGPFVEGTALKKTLRFLRKAFPYYTVKKHLKIKCTYCHLGLCPGPLLFETPPSTETLENIKEYKKNIKKLSLILKGKRKVVLTSLKKEMKGFSKEKNFEEAGKIRDKILALQQVMSHTSVIAHPQVIATSDVAQTLAGILGLREPVGRIECYDVSNIQGKLATSSMVVFKDGKADKSQYKKFKIIMKNEPNDIAMLKETLERRFRHPEWPLPDVILIDGGIAQLNVAIRAKDLNLKTRPIKIISIAKRNKDLYIEGRKNFIPLKTLPQEVYNLILQLDDEAHRFAITYHKKLRRKNLLVKR